MSYPEPEPSELIKEAIMELDNEPEPLQDHMDEGPITITLPAVILRNDFFEQLRIQKV
jgi:hypothetical protein